MGAIKKAVGTAAGIGVAYAASFGFAAGAEFHDQDSKTELRKQQQLVSIDQRQLGGLGRSIIAQHGNRCLSLMVSYADGALANGDFDASVNDIVDSSSQECGDDAVQVGNDLSDYKQAYSNLTFDSQTLGSVTHSADRSTASILTDSAEKAAIFDGFLLGCVAFGLLLAGED